LAIACSYPIACRRRIAHAGWGSIVGQYGGGSEGVGMTKIDTYEALRKSGSVDKVVSRILHICAEDGQELPVGNTGLIYFEGENHLRYHNDPERTREFPSPGP
jgi:fatty-acyl-CoA synthase